MDFRDWPPEDQQWRGLLQKTLRPRTKKHKFRGETQPAEEKMKGRSSTKKAFQKHFFPKKTLEKLSRYILLSIYN